MENKARETNGADDARLRRVDSSGSQKELVSNGVIQVEEVSHPNLKRGVGLIGGTSLIVGTMIGSGIFISPKGVLRGSGSVALSLIVWFLCGLLSMGGALSLAELGTLIPQSGGEYSYILEGFGSFGRLGAVPAFLCSWVNVIVLKPSSVSIISLTCAEYIMAPIFDDGCGTPPEANKKMLAAVVILIIIAANIFSVKLATRIQVIFTVAKLLALVIIIIGGIVRLIQGHTQHLATGFQGTQTNIGRIAIGFYNGMWAYDGWNNLNYVTEELKKPTKNLPRSILIGIPLVTVVYLLTNISYFTVMSPQQLLDSPAVAVTWARAVIRPVFWIIPIFVAFSTFGAANGTLFTSGRIPYVAGRNGHMLKILSMIHVQRFTPLPSLLLTGIIALLMIIPTDIESLIDFFNFTAWIFYGMTMVALLVLRWTKRDEHRPYKVPIFIPVIVLLASLYLVVAPIIDNPQWEFLYALILVLLGLVLYFPFVFFKLEIPGMSVITTFFQMIMQVSPPLRDSDI